MNPVLFLALALIGPPNPPGWTPSPSPVLSPKQAEFKASLGTGMVKVNVPSPQVIVGFAITNLTVANGQATLAWQQGLPPFQIWGSPALTDSFLPRGNSTLAHTKSVPVNQDHFWKLEQHRTLPFTQTNLVLNWVVPETDMSDSIPGPIEIWKKTGSAPPDPDDPTIFDPVWSLVTSLPITAPPSYQITPAPTEKTWYKLRMTTAQGYVIPHDEPFANPTTAAARLLGFPPAVRTPTAVRVNGNFAFLTADGAGVGGDYGLTAVDVSDVTNPLAKTCSTVQFKGKALAINTARAVPFACVIGKGLVYSDPTTLTTPETLYMFNISSPASALPIIGQLDTGWFPYTLVSVAISPDGNYAYVTSRNAGGPGGRLEVVSLSNLSSPIHVGGYTISTGFPSGVTLGITGTASDSKIYVMLATGGVLVLTMTSATTFANPVIVPVSGNAISMAINTAGSTGYIAANDSAQKMNLSNNQIGPSLSLNGHASEIKILGPNLYVANGGTMAVVDSATMTSLGSGYTLSAGGITSVDTDGTTIFLSFASSQSGGLLDIGISAPNSPAAPVLVGPCQLYFDGTKVAMKSGLAAISATRSPAIFAGQNPSFVAQLIDTTVPSHPTIRGRIDYSSLGLGQGRGLGFSTDGTKLYACVDSFVKVITFADLDNPIVAGSYTATSFALAVTAVSSTLAYMTQGSTASGKLFRALDISQINPTELWNVAIPSQVGSQPQNFVIFEGRAYIANSESLVILNLTTHQIEGSTSVSPVRIAESYDVKVARMSVGGQQRLIAFTVAGGGNIFNCVDVTDPANPQLIGSKTLPVFGSFQSLTSVAIIGSTALCGGGDVGILAFDITDPRIPSQKYSLKMPGLIRGVATDGSFIGFADAADGIDVIQP